MTTRPVPFVHYMRPNGRQERIEIELPNAIADKAEAILATGMRFEAELLTTGEVSFTVSDPENGFDLDIEVVANGPGVKEAVMRMIDRYAARMEKRNA